MKIKIGKKTLEADLADNSLSHMKGLGFSKKRNIFFVMHYEKRWRMWMFGVSYPISIIFIGKNKKVIDIKKAVPITSDPKTWKIYSPKKPCKYILETPFRIGVKIGTKINW